MPSILLLLLGIFISALPLPLRVYAANSGDVVINEISWMGTVESYNNEWLELYNTTPGEINLDGWILRATDGTPKINLTGIIAGNGYFLLERTDDNTVPEQLADQIYTGALGNSGEHLELVDAQGNVTDDVNSWGNWFAGDNATKQTMERKKPIFTGSDAATWAGSIATGGTPKAQNSVYGREQESQEWQSSTTTVTAIQTQPNSTTTVSWQENNILVATTTIPQPSPPPFAENILISEIMPAPAGADENMEWIEITNEGNAQADVSLWKVKDNTGAINTYDFPENSLIAAHSLLVLSRQTTKITLNNDADGVELVRSDGEVVQVVNYTDAPEAQSFARTENTWQWTQVPTPGSANIISQAIKETTKPQSGMQNTKEKEGENLPLVPKPKANKLLTQNLSSITKIATTSASSSNLREEPSNDSSAPRQLASAETAYGATDEQSYTWPAAIFIASALALLSAGFILLLKKRAVREK